MSVHQNPHACPPPGTPGARQSATPTSQATPQQVICIFTHHTSSRAQSALVVVVVLLSLPTSVPRAKRAGSGGGKALHAKGGGGKARTFAGFLPMGRRLQEEPDPFSLANQGRRLQLQPSADEVEEELSLLDAAERTRLGKNITGLASSSDDSSSTCIFLSCPELHGLSR